MVGIGPLTQDWEPMVIRKKKPQTSPPRRMRKSSMSLVVRLPRTNPSKNLMLGRIGQHQVVLL
ncbi:hypothetical protein REPUB_Repub03eG0173100 [Reevesia pubescens]